MVPFSRTIVTPEDITLLQAAAHRDPFAILGPHSTKKKNIIQVATFRADAEKCQLLCTSGKKLEMTQLADGLFWVEVPAVQVEAGYQFCYTFTDGEEYTCHDPYRFGSLLTAFDRQLFTEGNHHHIHEKMGAIPTEMDGVSGVYFAVWAPCASRVSVVGDFCYWDGRTYPMRMCHDTGIWDIFIPGIQLGTLYKYEVKTAEGDCLLKSDPYGRFMEKRPGTASIVYDFSGYKWHDDSWMKRRETADHYHAPMSCYEMHLGSWQRDDDGGFLSYEVIAERLIPYVKDMGFTHIELMPVSEHPLDESWGYQVSGFFAASSRFGCPEGLMHLIDRCHQNGIGVIIDWVPAHFPKDAAGLAGFDGTSLYEHSDPRQGEHQDWGTLIFNYGRHEVQNFLIANAIFWCEKYHIDGLRVDAVASMLYLDYSREDGAWIPNRYGGRENLDAIEFLKKFNSVVHHYFPGILTIAEESTSFPGVSRPVYLGGLGFGFKWNMGWMNDTLDYIENDPIHRRYHQGKLTFAMLYAYSENFFLVLSHDEVVHGKRSLLNKMPGDFWQKFANVRVFLGYYFTFPGKKLLFMGNEFGQWNEWNSSATLQWHLLQFDPHQRLRSLVTELNKLYTTMPQLHAYDHDHSGFEWVDFHDVDASIISYIRKSPEGKPLICLFNFTPVPRYDYDIGVDRPGYYCELINTDSEHFGGSNMGNAGGVSSHEGHRQGRSHYLTVTVPPLAMVVFVHEG